MHRSRLPAEVAQANVLITELFTYVARPVLRCSWRWHELCGAACRRVWSLRRNIGCDNICAADTHDVVCRTCAAPGAMPPRTMMNTSMLPALPCRGMRRLLRARGARAAAAEPPPQPLEHASSEVRPSRRGTPMVWRCNTHGRHGGNLTPDGGSHHPHARRCVN